jgi:hypothetical protein
VATEVLLLLQAPPDVVSLSIAVAPLQSTAAPTTDDGDGSSITVWEPAIVEKQPFAVFVARTL